MSSAVSQTLLIVSARVTTVDPRDFYTWALRRGPGGRRAAGRRLRVLLQGLANPALERARGHTPASPGFATGALRVLGVDIACVGRSRAEAVRILRGAGYGPTFGTPDLVCLRRPAGQGS